MQAIEQITHRELDSSEEPLLKTHLQKPEISKVFYEKVVRQKRDEEELAGLLAARPLLINSSGAFEENHELDNKSGALWEFIESKVQGGGGCIDTFRLAPRYYEFQPGTLSLIATEAAIKKHEEIFPAIEPMGISVNILKNMIHERNPNKPAILASVFQRLGYRLTMDSDGVLFFVPNAEFLMQVWKELQEEFPQLPLLTIASSKGVADDLELIEAYRSSADALLAKVGVHDHVNHVIPAIGRMFFFMGRYNALKDRFVRLIDKDSQRIKAAYNLIEECKKDKDLEKWPISVKELGMIESHLNEIEFVLSASIDSMTTTQPFLFLAILNMKGDSLVDSGISSYWTNSLYERYRNERFPEGVISPIKLLKVWELIKGLLPKPDDF